MDVNSDTPPVRAATELRVRWGNVALALAALIAIVAAVWLPRGGAEPREATALTTASAPTPPTAAGGIPAARSPAASGRSRRRHASRARAAKEHRRHRTRASKRSPQTPAARPAPAAALPVQDAPPTHNPPEFGL